MKLPIIRFKGVKYVYDNRLRQLRTVRPLKFINLTEQENELMQFAVNEKSRSLIRANMEDLSYKL